MKDKVIYREGEIITSKENLNLDELVWSNIEKKAKAIGYQNSKSFYNFFISVTSVTIVTTITHVTYLINVTLVPAVPTLNTVTIVTGDITVIIS